MNREFTGRHMAMVLVGGFGIVVAVNFFMASLAVGGFGGVVVENSYVASQKFNGWLDEADRQEALGWTASIARTGDGRLEVATSGIPTAAHFEATVRRPLGEPETGRLSFIEASPNRFVSTADLPAGRWIVRLAITSGSTRWATEEQIR